MLTVADIMTPDPSTVNRQASLTDVMGMMKACACRQIPVVENDQVIGIITDRDIRLAMNSPFVLHERRQDQDLLTHVTAEACMTREPMTIEAEAPAAQAAELMKTYKFGSLPVTSGGKLIGIVTVSDILRSYMDLLREKTAQS
ncbi:MAG TPA: CBS domain-containing protein [Phototrophicaceae bacterium]|nr:CBS domain-containing protein [Phototrophicaceae bacterium]